MLRTNKRSENLNITSINMYNLVLHIYKHLLFQIFQLALTYPVVWCISLEDCYHKRSVGWLVSITGIFCSLSIFVLGLDVIVLLDSFVIPIYLLTFMALELFGLFYIYGNFVFMFIY